jgi:hypothetical protein
MKSGNLKFLEPSGPLQAGNGTDCFTCCYLQVFWDNKIFQKSHLETTSENIRLDRVFYLCVSICLYICFSVHLYCLTNQWKTMTIFYGFWILFVNTVFGGTSWVTHRPNPKPVSTHNNTNTASHVWVTFESTTVVHEQSCEPYRVLCVRSRTVDRAIVSDRPVHKVDLSSYRQM